MPAGTDRLLVKMMRDKLNKWKPLPINLGTIVFFLIIVYLAFYVVTYLSKDKLAVYEVSASDIEDKISGTGIVIRDETVYTLEQDGYVNHYLQDSARVSKGGTVYMIDTSGKIQAYLNGLEAQEIMTDTERDRIIERLRTFSESYSDDNFSAVYESHRDISHDLTAYLDTVLAKHSKELRKRYGKDSYVAVKAKDSGIVSFSSDGLENLEVKAIDRDTFVNKAKMVELQSSEKQKKGDPVYRLVRGQNWKLIVPLDEGDYFRLNKLKKKEISKVDVFFGKDNFTIQAAYDCRKINGSPYAILTFDDYVQRYINQRYLYVEIILSSTKGLKIPSSSIVEKEVFQIPGNYLVRGSNSRSKDHINLVVKDQDGETRILQRNVKVYKNENGIAWINGPGLEEGMEIADERRENTMNLPATTTFQGVYSINRGYTIFRIVSIEQRNEDYCIISISDSEVALYDRIILNSSTVKENQVIY